MRADHDADAAGIADTELESHKLKKINSLASYGDCSRDDASYRTPSKAQLQSSAAAENCNPNITPIHTFGSTERKPTRHSDQHSRHRSQRRLRQLPTPPNKDGIRMHTPEVKTVECGGNPTAKKLLGSSNGVLPEANHCEGDGCNQMRSPLQNGSHGSDRHATEDCSSSTLSAVSGEAKIGNFQPLPPDNSNLNGKELKDAAPHHMSSSVEELEEKSGGNWRLQAVLEALQDTDASCLTSPSRPGRVKTLVRAFESLMSSSSDRNHNDEEKHRGFPLQFSYHNIDAGLPTSVAQPNKLVVEESTAEYLNADYGGGGINGSFSNESGHQESYSSKTKTENIEESSTSSDATGTFSASWGEQQEHTNSHFTVGKFSSRMMRKKPSGRPRKYQASWPSKSLNCDSADRRTADSMARCKQHPQHQLRSSMCFKTQQPQPFKLRTEARGQMKEQEFLKRLRDMLAEEEKLRVPQAQGLPWSTDEPEIPPKPPVKESTRPVDLHLRTEVRATERAEFDNLIMEKLLYVENRRRDQEMLHKLAEEKEIKKLRQEMVPKAQLMPYFDRPFRPRRSSKRPTIPKEPQFHHNSKLAKRAKCTSSINNTNI